MLFFFWHNEWVGLLFSMKVGFKGLPNSVSAGKGDSDDYDDDKISIKKGKL